MIKVNVSKLEQLQLENKSIKSLIVPILVDDLEDYISFYKNQKKRIYNRSLSLKDYIETYDLPCPIGNHIAEIGGKSYGVETSYSFASDINYEIKARCGCMSNPNSGPFEQQKIIHKKFKKWFNNKFRLFKKVGMNYHNFSMTPHGVKSHKSGTSKTYINPICVIVEIK